MKLLIEIEGPGADRPVPGEPGVIEQVEAFTRRLVEQRSPVARAAVTVRRLDDDVVPVKAEQLVALQARAIVADWVTHDVDAMLALMNHSKPPPEIAYRLGEFTGDRLKGKAPK